MIHRPYILPYGSRFKLLIWDSGYQVVGIFVNETVAITYMYYEFPTMDDEWQTLRGRDNASL